MQSFDKKKIIKNCMLTIKLFSKCKNTMQNYCQQRVMSWVRVDRGGGGGDNICRFGVVTVYKKRTSCKYVFA